MPQSRDGAAVEDGSGTFRIPFLWGRGSEDMLPVYTIHEGHHPYTSYSSSDMKELKFGLEMDKGDMSP